jgi:L-fucose mutarotase
MLKGIPYELSPELLKILCEMGHGDEIVLGDGNFPAATNARRLVRADGLGVPQMLAAILKVIPLDTYVDAPVALMETLPTEERPAIWDEYERIVAAENGPTKIERIERFAFYERAKKAFAVVATGETAIYANVILKKGVVK